MRSPRVPDHIHARPGGRQRRAEITGTSPFAHWPCASQGQGCTAVARGRYTWGGPAIDLGRSSAGPGRVGRPAGLRSASALACEFGSGPCRGGRAGGPWSAEGTSAGGAVCSRRSAARRSRRGAGDGSTGTGKSWQSIAEGSVGHGSAGSRPARSASLRRLASPPERRAAGRIRGAGTRDGQQSWQTV